GWERHLDEETGAAYYSHPETGVTSWDLPFTTVGDAGEEGHTAQNGRETLVLHDNDGEGETPRAGSAAVDVTGDEWQEVVDPDSGSSYFYNPSTRQSTWSMP
ncbi:unnamed protein product, partial [Ectocarpus sp. 8 AP-2014]